VYTTLPTDRTVGIGQILNRSKRQEHGSSRSERAPVDIKRVHHTGVVAESPAPDGWGVHPAAIRHRAARAGRR